MLPKALKDRLEAEIRNAEHPRELAVDVMFAIQDRCGYLSDEALAEAAAMLGMTSLELDELATFYTFTFREPVGKYVIHVCDSVVCWMNGCETVRGYLCRRLGIGVGDDPGEVREKVGHLRDALGELLSLPPLDDRTLDEAFCFDYGFGAYGTLAGPVMDLIREVGSREGFFLDPVYTGKAFYGLLDRIRRGIVPLASRVLFLHTGGLSGLFQYEEEVHRHLAGTD